MARRRGKPNDYLFTDDYSGVTTYRSKVQEDYWGNWTKKPWLRNLQEIASPLGDPFPVPVFRGSQYEQTNACQFEISPPTIGNTNIPFPQNSAYAQFVNLNPSIPDMSIGCTFIVQPDLPYTYITTEDGTPITTESGAFLVLS